MPGAKSKAQRPHVPPSVIAKWLREMDRSGYTVVYAPSKKGAWT